MTIIIANNIHDEVRGMLRRWFLEPKPNVFIADINSKVRKKTLDYIVRNSGGAGLMIIYDDNSVQGFKIDTYGNTKADVDSISGIQLIVKKE